MSRLATQAAVLGAVLLAGAACTSGPSRDDRGASLTVRQPAEQSLRRGTNCVLRVAVSRHNVVGPVTVRFENLPQGVSVLESNPRIANGENEVAVTLVAERDAAVLSGHFARVVAQGPEGVSAAEGFRVSVLD